MSRTFLVADELVGRLRAHRVSLPAQSDRRFLVGVCGPPGAGKSTLADRLGDELDAPVVPMDGFHLPNAVLDERGLRAVKGAPRTFDARGFVDVVRALGAGDDMSVPAFDRLVDEREPGAIRVPAGVPMVIVEGNYLALDAPPWSELTSLIDLVAYVDLDHDVRIRRLVDRHVEFGRSPQEAVAFVHDSDEANTALIAAGRHRADVVVRGV